MIPQLSREIGGQLNRKREKLVKMVVRPIKFANATFKKRELFIKNRKQ